MPLHRWTRPGPGAGRREALVPVRAAARPLRSVPVQAPGPAAVRKKPGAVTFSVERGRYTPRSAALCAKGRPATLPAYRYLFCLLVCALGLLGARPIPATTVVRLDVDELVARSALVVAGEVVETHAAWNETRTLIETHVTLRVDEVLKGEHAGPELTLKFAGGALGDRAFEVATMVYPKAGERGVFFVEDPEAPLIHPLVGWSQGHFLFARDAAGVEHVLTEDGHPVRALARGRRARRSVGGEVEFSHGVARGIEAGATRGDVAAGMRREAFLAEIRARVRAGFDAATGRADR